MTPPDCDLRGYDYMPLFGHQLFSSVFWAESTDEERVTALQIWWAAWLQCPAASLPDNDRAIAHLAGYGRDLKAWARVRERVLHGFVPCTDGRLYHRFLSIEAVKAYAIRLKSDAKRKGDRERLHAWRLEQKQQNEKQASSTDGNASGNAQETPSETPSETSDETPDETSPETPSETEDETEDETRFVAGRSEVKLLEEKERTPQPSVGPPKAARRSRIDVGWWPNEAGIAKANSVGIIHLEREVSRFRDHHAAKGSLMADWAAAWRTWCGNFQAFAKPSPKFTPGRRGALEALGLVDNVEEPFTIQGQIGLLQ